MTNDSPELQDLLGRLFPGLVLTGIAKASGQRVVYFCKFDAHSKGDPDWIKWGNVVLKVSSGVDPQSIAYMQMEIEVLKNLDSPGYPKMHYYEFFAEDPDTEEKLPERIFVTIENRIDAKPLIECQERFQTEAYLNFLSELKDADLDVLVGYLNTEAVMFTLLDDITLTFGTFENTRMFSLDKFVVSNEDRRGPRARIYMPALLNWIQFDQAQQIRKAVPELWSEIYEGNKYGDEALNAFVEPTFNQPQLYKHYFLCFARQIKDLQAVNAVERAKVLRDWITSASAFYKRIRAENIVMEKHGGGAHLGAWLNAVNAFEASHL